ncbi:MAG TPA: hypothetical protein VGR96_06745 [Acidobacteriaceae bacterium]|nr:hypothetical protein [Acidobacteriaceae bacterium]
MAPGRGLWRLWASGDTSPRLSPVFLVFISFLPGFLKPDTLFSPLFMRFGTLFPLFQRERLLLLAKEKPDSRKNNSSRRSGVRGAAIRQVNGTATGEKMN